MSSYNILKIICIILMGNSHILKVLKIRIYKLNKSAI